MEPGRSIGREQVVRRHNPVMTSAHPTGVFTVGNGDAAMSVDLTGLQSDPRFHEMSPAPARAAFDGFEDLPEQPVRAFALDDYQIPLRTQSTWAWVESRPLRPFALDEAATGYATDRGVVPYLDRMGLQRPADSIPDDCAAGAWFQFNPRRAHLGRLALVRPGGNPLDGIDRIEAARTELDLWTGSIQAEFRLEGSPVSVTTVADPATSRFATRVASPLLKQGWGVAWVFDPQPDDLSSFEHPLREVTKWMSQGAANWVGQRTVETLEYFVDVRTTGRLSQTSDDAVMATCSGEELEVVATLHKCANGPRELRTVGSFEDVRSAAAAWWLDFWQDGAFVTFEGSTDSRADELERRVILSQYLTVVNCAGETPPAETGLTYNTWSGKFHLEMHWWHGAHFPLWNRSELLERSIGWYHAALPMAKETARWQGFAGARWPKQTSPSGRESPSSIGVFLLWQQPHVIYLLELLRMNRRDEGFLESHYPLIEATADFMADFVRPVDGVFTLPPPLIPAQESYLGTRKINENPTLELAYWVWALTTANEWRARLGLPAREEWERVANHMCPPKITSDGTYAALTSSDVVIGRDHPSMLMALGWLPDTDLIDRSTMSATLEWVWSTWDLQTTWGWDYPVLSMTAARLGDARQAIEALLMPSAKNVFLPNGHNPQMPGFLSLYLPANGGLLAAVARLVEALCHGAQLPDGWSMSFEGFPCTEEASNPREGGDSGSACSAPRRG